MTATHFATAICRLLVIALFACAGFAVRAQDTDTLTMNMRDADIRALIQWVADNTGKNIVVHKDVKGKVNVLSAQPLTPEEAYQVFLSVLQVEGFAAIETPEALKIVPQALASGSGLPLASDQRGGSDMVVSLLKLRNSSASQMADLVRPLLSANAVIAPYPASNALIVADRMVNISTVQRLIDELDMRGGEDIQVLALRHANAADIASSLQQLLATEGETSRVSLSVDERSNSLLMAGDPALRKKLQRIVKQLDQELDGDGNTQVVYLHYVDAGEVAPILKNLADNIQKQKKEESGSISVEASTSANALVINAPPAVLATMKRVVSQLDIRRAQVLVEALVVEVSGDVANDIGVSWTSTDLTNLDDSDVVTSVNTLGNLPLVSPNPTVYVDPATGETESLPFSPGQGITLGYFNNGNIQAAIRALKTTTRANILSTPTIIAIDNEEASLLVGQNVPFKTGQETNAASETSNPFVTVERQDIGLSLVITPRINQGDSITLEIMQKTENVTDSVENAFDLVTNKREIITKALIKDGQTLVLGGLISDNETETQTRIPFLGSLPLVGKLFSSSGVKRTKTNLMVFIRPQILKDEEHIARVTRQRYQFMESKRDLMVRELWDIANEQPPAIPEFDTFSPSGGKP